MAQYWVKQGWITTYSQGTWDAGKAMLHGQRALRLWLEFVAYLELFFIVCINCTLTTLVVGR
jgi:hypothetical protein